MPFPKRAVLHSRQVAVAREGTDVPNDGKEHDLARRAVFLR